ncbi:MAG: 2-oxoacid:acceptor oxidoreductase subunit alpha [Halobacteriales archaeon]
MTEELIWRIAGGSGDGIDSTSQNFAKALMRSGLHIFTHRHYPSRIRGGHTYAEVRAAAEPVGSRGDGFNFLLALGDSFGRSQTSEHAVYGNEEIKPLSENLDDLRDGGVIVYDEGLIDVAEVEDFEARAEEHDWHVYPLDLRGLAREVGREVMRNTAGVGATVALTGMDLDPIEALMEDTMSGDVLEQNREILETAHQAVVDDYDVDAHDVRVPEGTDAGDQVLVSGSHAIAYGAIDEGCRFISGYPMTPWTDVFTIMSQRLPEIGGVSEQVEDEIAAASMAIGASHAGAKAMSGSSGGGFALMSEPLGMAEMVEEPLVLVEAMRAGPSTGMPTKTEQGDLEHVLYTSQGDSTRVVLAPGTPAEAYEQTRLAFRIAYDFNVPVVVLYDQKLGGEYRTMDASVFDREPNPTMGATLDETDLADAPHHPAGKFERYRYDAEGGVSPRSIPGQEGGRFLASGNEHWPTGHIAEDQSNRVRQTDRRLAKYDAIRAFLDDREGSNQTAYGPESADYGILTWGSNQGTVEEAVDRLNADGDRVRALSVSELRPFPDEAVAAFLEGVDEALVVEMNATGQFRGLVQRELGRFGDRLYSLLKYDGEPFEPAEVVDGFETRLDGGVETKPAFNTRMEPAVGD